MHPSERIITEFERTMDTLYRNRAIEAKCYLQIKHDFKIIKHVLVIWGVFVVASLISIHLLTRYVLTRIFLP